MRTFKKELKYIYGINTLNNKNRIHDNEVNKRAK